MIMSFALEVEIATVAGPVPVPTFVRGISGLGSNKFAAPPDIPNATIPESPALPLETMHETVMVPDEGHIAYHALISSMPANVEWVRSVKCTVGVETTFTVTAAAALQPTYTKSLACVVLKLVEQEADLYKHLASFDPSMAIMEGVVVVDVVVEIVDVTIAVPVHVPLNVTVVWMSLSASVPVHSPETVVVLSIVVATTATVKNATTSRMSITEAAKTRRWLIIFVIVMSPRGNVERWFMLVGDGRRDLEPCGFSPHQVIELRRLSDARTVISSDQLPRRSSLHA
jgi:hypothetical protein